jgi:hypothetical protein
MPHTSHRRSGVAFEGLLNEKMLSLPDSTGLSFALRSLLQSPGDATGRCAEFPGCQTEDGKFRSATDHGRDHDDLFHRTSNRLCQPSIKKQSGRGLLYPAASRPINRSIGASAGSNDGSRGRMRGLAGGNDRHSRQHRFAVSPKGAVGLMQLMPRTASVLEVKDPFDPQDNVSAGTKLLRQLLQHYDGNLALTLGAYNAGPRRVDADMAVPGIPETTNYVRRILSMLPMDEMRDLSFDSGFDH